MKEYFRRILLKIIIKEHCQGTFSKNNFEEYYNIKEH